MAFTEVEVKEAEAAICSGASREDLFKLGLIYSTDVEDRHWRSAPHAVGSKRTANC